jgi:pantothenate kinase-related protein Tda10
MGMENRTMQLNREILVKIIESRLIGVTKYTDFYNQVRAAIGFNCKNFTDELAWRLAQWENGYWNAVSAVYDGPIFQYDYIFWRNFLLKYYQNLTY